MPQSTDWRTAALNQKVRADRLEERETDLEHAINLLVNDVVEWFAEYRTLDGASHQFGIGVAMNAPIDNRLAAAAMRREKENRAVVFWKTVFENGHKFMTAYSIEDFKTYPKRYYAAAPEAQKPDSVVELVTRASELVDEAYKSYVARRQRHSTPESHVM